MCMHAVLLYHGEVSLVRLRAVWMTSHFPVSEWGVKPYQTCILDQPIVFDAVHVTLGRMSEIISG